MGNTKPVILQGSVPCRTITLNQRLHWAIRAAFTRNWRTAGWAAANQRSRPRQLTGRWLVTVILPVKGTRRRDPSNWMPTVKAIVDGLVDAGVWPDDNSDSVVVTEPLLDPHRDPLTFEIQLRPYDQP